jgi:hypothetical protein
MKKIIQLLLGILFYTLSIQNTISQIDTISLKTLRLKGPVMSVSEFTYSAKDSLGTIVKDEYLKDEPGSDDWKFEIDDSYGEKKTNVSYNFDRNGNLTSKKTYHNPNFPYEVTKYNYINKLLTEYNETLNFSDMIITLKHVLKYDSQNKLISIITYRDGELFKKVIYKYDEGKNLSEKTEIDNNGTISESTIYKYINNRLILERLIKEGANSECSYKYDSLGNVIFESIKYIDDGYYFETHFEYNGNVLVGKYYPKVGKMEKKEQELFEYQDGKLHKITYMVGEENSITKQEVYIYNPDNSMQITTTKKGNQIIKEFDKYDNQTKLLTTSNDQNREEFTYEYSYDKQGNCLKIIEYKNTMPLKVLERRIKYY